MSSQNTLTYPFRGTVDAELVLHDAAVKTATFSGENGGSAKVIDLGASTPSDDVPAVAGYMVVDVRAITINDNNESYIFVLETSDTAAFDTNVEEVAVLRLGAKEILSGGANAVDTAVGRYAVPFHTGHARNGVARRYARLRCIVAGTTPSITAYAWMTKN